MNNGLWKNPHMGTWGIFGVCRARIGLALRDAGHLVAIDRVSWSALDLETAYGRAMLGSLLSILAWGKHLKAYAGRNSFIESTGIAQGGIHIGHLQRGTGRLSG
jgi:hypothetical protein